MSTYVKVKNGIVVKAIEADSSFISSYSDGEAGKWVQILADTSYGVGWKYKNNAFTPPRPYSSWIWNDSDSTWEAPVAKPSTDNDDDFLSWNDDTQQWDIEVRDSDHA